MSNLTQCREDLIIEPSKAIQSPVVSDQGVRLAVLTITATITEASAEAGVQEALSANSEMVSAPNDPTDQVQPALAIGAALTTQSGLEGVLKRLDEFMRLADLAAEVRCHCSVVLAGRVA